MAEQRPGISLTEQRIREIVREEIRLSKPCTCQYGNDEGRFTPYWYATVRTCKRHKHLFNPSLAPGWWDTATNSYRD